jgi:hypothetical protein
MKESTKGWLVLLTGLSLFLTWIILLARAPI